MERELDLQILVNKENQADLTPIQSIREFKNQLCEWTYSSTNKCSYNQLWWYLNVIFHYIENRSEIKFKIRTVNSELVTSFYFKVGYFRVGYFRVGSSDCCWFETAVPVSSDVKMKNESFFYFYLIFTGKFFSHTKVFPRSSIRHMHSLDLNYKMYIWNYFKIWNLGKIHSHSGKSFSIAIIYHAFVLDQIFYDFVAWFALEKPCAKWKQLVPRNSELKCRNISYFPDILKVSSCLQLHWHILQSLNE